MKRPFTREPSSKAMVKPVPKVRADLKTAPQKALLAKSGKIKDSSNVPRAPAKKEDVKKPEELPSEEPMEHGYYELSPLMSKLLEEELQSAMAKVWQVLPEDTNDEAEKLVVSKFRNKAGDALRNVLGLNVTRRLLSVNSNLYVELTFSSKPLRTDVIEFINKYKMTGFKRIGARGGKFSAKLRSFRELDELCASKKLYCGKVPVYVAPCFQFLNCPPNLRTIYDGKSTSSLSSEKTIPTSGGHEKTEPQKAEDKADSKTKVKDGDGTANKADPATNKPPSKETSKPIAKDTTVQQKSPVEKYNQSATESKQKVLNKPVPAKQNTAKVSPANPATEHKQNIDTKAIPNKVASQVPAKSNVVAAKSDVAATKPNVAVTKPNVSATKPNVAGSKHNVAATKPNVAATKPNVAATKPHVAATKPNVAATKTNVAATKPNVASKLTPNRAAAAKSPQKATKPANLASKQISKQENDFDELDDRDILALLSEGIVLDECSGSDEG